jgi:hypothetical protein
MRDHRLAVFGYARVSTDGQTLASQDAELMKAGCAKVFAEKVSGARADRHELAKLLRDGEYFFICLVALTACGPLSISSNTDACLR